MLAIFESFLSDSTQVHMAANVGPKSTIKHFKSNHVRERKRGDRGEKNRNIHAHTVLLITWYVFRGKWIAARVGALDV